MTSREQVAGAVLRNDLFHRDSEETAFAPACTPRVLKLYEGSLGGKVVADSQDGVIGSLAAKVRALGAGIEDSAFVVEKAVDYVKGGGHWSQLQIVDVVQHVARGNTGV